MTRTIAFLLRLALSISLVSWVSPALSAAPRPQDDPPAEADEEAATAEGDIPTDAIPTPATLEEALETDSDDLAEALEAAELADREACLAVWMEWVRGQESGLLEAQEAPEGSELHEQAAALGADRDVLIAITEVVLVAVAAAGGDVSAEREELADIRDTEASELDRVSTVPSDANEAQELTLGVLKAELRPLTREQVEDQLSLWLALLQKKCLEVRKVEVAALESEDSGEISKFNARGVELRAERDELIKRVDAVIDDLENKAGDVTEARAYVSSVIVAPLITGWRAALTTGKAWLTSASGGVRMAEQIFLATLTLVIAWFLARFAGRLAERALRGTRKVSELLREFLVSSVRRSTLLLGVLVALSRMGFDMTPLLATIGATGLVIGLALQNTLSNFASGIMIMIYRPFDVGDVISVAATVGTVKGLNLVTTHVITFDNQSIYIPNNKIWGDVITNVTANPTRRVDMTFGIAYEDDIRKAKEILLDVVTKHEKVLDKPAPIVEVHELGDSSVNFICRPWTRTVDYWDLFWDLNHKIKERFDAEGISIPFPQRDVHVHHTGAPGSSGDGWIQPSPPKEHPEEQRVEPSGDQPEDQPAERTGESKAGMG